MKVGGALRYDILSFPTYSTSNEIESGEIGELRRGAEVDRPLQPPLPDSVCLFAASFIVEKTSDTWKEGR
jgi:hypothetical protein